MKYIEAYIHQFLPVYSIQNLLKHMKDGSLSFLFDSNLSNTW